MDDEAFARVVIAGFLEDVPRQIARLKRHVDAGDAGQIEHQAHQLKGACATAGAEALRALATAIEHAGKAGDLALISDRMPEMDARFEALKQAMTSDV